MEPKLKGILKSLSLSLRHILEGYYDGDNAWHPGDLERRLNEIGVWRDRDPKPTDELPFLSTEDKRTREVVDAYLSYRRQAGVSRSEAVAEFVRESSYTWANRLLALRCMESRGIIDEVILQKEVYGWRSLQHHRHVQRYPEQASGDDEGLYRVFFNEFTERVQDLPELFNPNSLSVALKPSVAALKRCISLLSGREQVNGGEYTSDTVFQASDALGWAYQYWNAEEKDRVFEKVRTKKAKIEGSDIISVTQIYTEPYMVKFLVQNSLGAQWMMMHPESRLSEKWEYYTKDATRSSVDPKPVREITFMDPACGSGHFLLEAFDLFYEMYLDEGLISQPDDICTSILNNNLYGLDIDGRAVQISQLSLWMKSKSIAPKLQYHHLSMFHNHIIAENVHLPRNLNQLEEFLRNNPEDLPLKEALEAVFVGLSNVDELGSLVQIEEPVERELLRLQGKQGYQTTLTKPMTREKIGSWGREALHRIREHFVREAVGSNLISSFFGESAAKGIEIFNLLSAKYDVIATNPPYMGTRSMGGKIKDYIETHYEPGKRDLYAAFILRSLKLLSSNGRLGIVTQQSWMFLNSFSKLRYNKNVKYNDFQGLLSDYKLELLAHLGTGAFQEIGGEVVNVVLFILNINKPTNDDIIIAFKINSQKTVDLKINLLKNIIYTKNKDFYYSFKQLKLIKIENAPIMYWISDDILDIFIKDDKFKNSVYVKQGIVTGNNDKFLRYFWEIDSDLINKKWIIYLKAGGYKKWSGLEYYCISWDHVVNQIHQNKVGRIRDSTFFGKIGWTYGLVAQGSISVRRLEKEWKYDNCALVVFPKKNIQIEMIGSFLNSYFASYLLRQLNQSISFNGCYIENLPNLEIINENAIDIVNKCMFYKELLNAKNIVEIKFKINKKIYKNLKELLFEYFINYNKIICNLLYLEYLNELIIFNIFNLNEGTINDIYKETGKQVGFYPFIKNYNGLEIIDKNFSNNIEPTLIDNNLYAIKEKLIKIFQYGFSNEINEVYPEEDSNKILDELEEKNISTYNPIPSEYLIEEISKKMEINPISIFHLLKEGIELENWRCIPEERRIIADYFTVTILLLLGYRWPKQIEEREPIPSWVDPDGIIPFTSGISKTPLIDRIRERIASDFQTDPSLIENEFQEIMGNSLQNWLKNGFFLHHVNQFKKRPIALQLDSQSLSESKMGRTRKGTSKESVFSCLIDYHKLDSELLRKIQTQYLHPLRSRYETELRTLEKIGNISPDQSERIITLRNIIEELKGFDSRLEGVITSGFEFNGLRDSLYNEPLDKWTSVDGLKTPPSTSEI